MSGVQKVVIITELKTLTPVSEEFCFIISKTKNTTSPFFRTPYRYQSAKTL